MDEIYQQGMTFYNLCKNMTVLQNIWLCRRHKISVGFICDID